MRFTIDMIKDYRDLARRGKNKLSLEVYSSIINTAQNLAIARKDKDNVSDDMVKSAINKEYKIIKEQIATCPKDRKDLLDTFLIKEAIVSNLMPKQMSEKELQDSIRGIIDRIKDDLDVEFDQPLDKKYKGTVMKETMSELADQDKSLISRLVGEYF